MQKKRKNRAKRSLKNVKQRATRLFLTIGIVSSLALVGYGAWTARHVLEPISSFAADAPKQVQDTSKEQHKFYTLVLDENDFVTSASLTIIDTHEHTLKTIQLPANTQMHLPYGLDQFKLSSLYKISELENSNELKSLVRQTLIDYFGVPSNTLYIVKNETDPRFSFAEWITHPHTLLKLAFDREWTQDKLITNQSSVDLLTLASTIHAIPDEFRSQIDIAAFGIGSIEQTKDGSEVIVTDQNKLDAYVKKSFQNIDVIMEKANIQIENGTEVIGLGSKYARAVNNLGGLVIDIGNSESKIEKTEIIIRDEKWKQSATVIELSNILGSNNLRVDTNLQATADVVVRLGENYAMLTQGKIE